MSLLDEHHREHYNDWPNAAGFNALGETRDPVQLLVTGTFPSYTAGSLYRTGPGGYKIPRKQAEDGFMACSHWFDGFTTMHKFIITPSASGTEIKYSSRSQVDELIEHARTTGKLDVISFGQKRDPCDTFYQKFKTVFSPRSLGSANTANIGVALRQTLPAEMARARQAHGDKRTTAVLTVVTDASTSKSFDADTLEPIAVSDQAHLHPALKGPLSAAHAAIDPVNGDVYNYNLDFGLKTTYRIFRATQDKVEILAEISGPDIRGAYIHSMFLTESFVILCIWPAFIKHGGASILWHRNVLDAIAPFDSASEATWLVVDRKTNRGLVKKFKSPAFFCFHSINAWESKTQDSDRVDVFCELVEFNNLDILHRFYYENLASDGAGIKASANGKRKDTLASLARYKLANISLSDTDPFGAKSQERAEKILSIPSPNAGDLPRIDPRLACKPHRYVYSVLDRGKSSFLDGIGKTDTKLSTCVVWEKARHSPGEPIFIANPEGTDEDDGVILTVVLDGDVGTSYLLCLNARNMQEIGRATLKVPVGFGFHGTHLASL